MSKNLSELSGRKGVEENLFDKMGKLALKTGAPSEKELEDLANDFLIGKSTAFGTTTFYDFLKPENKGKKAYACNGSACLCAGSQPDVIAQLKTKFKAEEIGHMTCLGRCHENSAFFYNGTNYSGNAINNLDEIIANNSPKIDNYHCEAVENAVLTETYHGLEKHYAPFKNALKKDPSKILEEIKTSGIRGRGGAGFPMGSKLEFCKNVENETKFIICNADEGDPGAYSDRYLLEQRPHSVLFGMMISGYVTGASWGILYIRAEYPESVAIIENAIQELKDAALLGENIDESGFNFNLKVIQAQGSYICGEETALINSIEGQRPEVRVRPPYPAVQGLFNKPTVVNNVETLAAVHFIIRDGGTAYANIGTGKSTGTKLICLDSFFNRPGVYEIEMGVSLNSVINDLGQGFKEPVKALHIGGPLGGIVPKEKFGDLTIDFESFATNGFLLGHASVVSIPQTFPMIEYLEHLFDFASYESCGKCFPCRLGTKRGQELMTKAITGEHKIDRYLLEDLLHTLEVGSLCAHGGGIPLPIKNTLAYFDDELSDYFAN
ncbi:MAG: NADH-ubiquinone oxidoreductase-F iron-sulfur binding region domain-containing protein [Flavobacteriales bacterium]|nr:NADH-ubiquinone oxidoreductase-F iron-sulfur binding region domain-containing protein [Flavobacteriales bacterium]